MRTWFRFLAVLISAIAICSGGQMSASQARVQSPSAQAAAKSRQIPPPEARVDINHASETDLLKVPGLTPSWAGRILRFRPYRTKQDLLDRGVLPSDVYDRIRDYVIAHREKQ